MALSQSVASELLEAFRAGEGVDLVRESVRLVMQELIETEASEVVGAGRYERNPSRVTERNGSRPRLVATQAGDVELRIPKLRQGSFFPVILERRRRIDQALYAVVMEAWVNGVSTRAVDDLVAALGIGSGISKSEVSRICAGLDEQVAAFRDRPLHHTAFPYVFLDATYLHVRRTGPGGTVGGGQVTSMAVVVATAVTADGGRDVSGWTSATRGRGVLARVPPHPQRAWPARRPAGHLRPTRRPRRRFEPCSPRGGPPTLPGPASQPPRPGAEVTQGHGNAVFRTAFAPT